jgi:hypothetical protein
MVAYMMWLIRTNRNFVGMSYEHFERITDMVPMIPAAERKRVSLYGTMAFVSYVHTAVASPFKRTLKRFPNRNPQF